MKNFSALFTIIEEKNCPLYRIEDSLILSEKTIVCPKGKEVCLILVRDMTQILFQLLGNTGKNDVSKTQVYNCSGCTGLIKFQLQDELDGGSQIKNGSDVQLDPATQILAEQIKGAELFQSFSEREFTDIIGNFKVIDFVKDGLIIQKGQLNLNLYMVVAGELVVEDDGIPIHRRLLGRDPE